MDVREIDGTSPMKLIGEIILAGFLVIVAFARFIDWMGH